MATVDFNAIFQELKGAVESLAKEKAGDYWKAAVGDADQFFNKTKDKLERWTIRLAKGELTPDDFEWLVKGEKDLAEMVLLREAGLTLIRVDEFKTALLDVVVKTVMGKIA
jgi:hypothetical protein